MNKKLLAAVIATTLTIPLAAQAEGAYVSLGVGKAKTSADVNNVNAITVSRTNGTAANLEFGYEFNKYFGVELGYANLGKSVDTINTTEVFNYRFSSYFLAGTGSVPLGPVSLFAKLGLANNRIDATDTAGGSSDHFNGGKIDMMGGVGAAFNFTKNVGLRVQYEYFGKVTSASSTTIVNNINGKGQMWSVGLLYKF